MGLEEIRQKTKEFYDQSAQAFSQTRSFWWDDLKFIKEYIPKNGKVLDLGCGNGRLVHFLRKNNFRGEYIGVDISEKLIQIAKEKYPKERFIIIKSEKDLPFKNNEFNAIFSVAVFHHFNPALAKNALGEIKRVIKPDGKIIITVWNLWQKKYLRFLIKNILIGKFSRMTELTFEDNERIYFRPCYWWIKSQLARIIKKTGFKITQSGVTYKNDKKRNIFFVLKKI